MGAAPPCSIRDTSCISGTASRHPGRAFPRSRFCSRGGGRPWALGAGPRSGMFSSSSEHPRVPGRLEESLPREVSPAVAGVQGRPPARRHEAGPGDPGGRCRGGHHWAIPLIRSSFGGLFWASFLTNRLKYWEVPLVLAPFSGKLLLDIISHAPQGEAGNLIPCPFVLYIFLRAHYIYVFPILLERMG